MSTLLIFPAMESFIERIRFSTTGNTFYTACSAENEIEECTQLILLLMKDNTARNIENACAYLFPQILSKIVLTTYIHRTLMKN